MHSCAPGAAAWMSLRSFSSAARLSPPTVARYWSIVLYPLAIFAVALFIGPPPAVFDPRIRGSVRPFPASALFESLADSENVAVRVPNVHLANVPWHVGRRPGDFDPLLEAVPVHILDIIHPDRHPGALVPRLVAAGAEGHLRAAPPAATLTVLAKEDLALARTHASERRGSSPIPRLLPSELLEPGKALRDVGNIQDGCQSLGVHPRFSIIY